MKKVYCLNCKFYRKKEYNKECMHKSNIDPRDTPTKQVYEQKLTPDERNKNNDCPDFDMSLIDKFLYSLLCFLQKWLSYFK